MQNDMTDVSGISGSGFIVDSAVQKINSEILNISGLSHLTGYSDLLSFGESTSSSDPIGPFYSSPPHLAPFGLLREIFARYDIITKYRDSKTTISIFAGLYFSTFVGEILGNYELVFIMGGKFCGLNFVPEMIRERFDLLTCFVWLLKNTEINSVRFFLHKMEKFKLEHFFLIVKLCVQLFSPPSLSTFLRFRIHAGAFYSNDLDSGSSSGSYLKPGNDLSSDFAISSVDYNFKYSASSDFLFKCPFYPVVTLNSYKKNAPRISSETFLTFSYDQLVQLNWFVFIYMFFDLFGDSVILLIYSCIVNLPMRNWFPLLLFHHAMMLL
jgi:hypothetical protein